MSNPFIYTKDALSGGFKYNQELSTPLEVSRDLWLSGKIIPNKETFTFSLNIKRVRVITGRLGGYAVYFSKYVYASKSWGTWTFLGQRELILKAGESASGIYEVFSNSSFKIDGTDAEPPVYRFKVLFYNSFGELGAFTSQSGTVIEPIRPTGSEAEHIIAGATDYTLAIEPLNFLGYDLKGQVIIIPSLSIGAQFPILSYTPNNDGVSDTIRISVFPVNSQTKPGIVFSNFLGNLSDAAYTFSEATEVIILSANGTENFRIFEDQVLRNIYAIPNVSIDGITDPEGINGPIIINTLNKAYMTAEFRLPISYFIATDYEYEPDYNNVYDEVWQTKISFRDIAYNEVSTSIEYLNNTFYKNAFIKVYIFIPHNQTTPVVDAFPTNNTTKGVWYFKQQIPLSAAVFKETIRPTVLGTTTVTPNEDYHSRTDYDVVDYNVFNINLSNMPKDKVFYIWLGIGFPSNLDLDINIKQIPTWQ